jgi:hypothetical protein
MVMKAVLNRAVHAGMQIKMLKAASDNSKRLIEWLEIGMAS